MKMRKKLRVCGKLLPTKGAPASELRDGMMIALTKRSRMQVGMIRNLIEIGVLIIGYFLGGTVGLGTLFMALVFGRLIQLVFLWFKFDVRQVWHRYVDEDIALLFQRFRSRKAG